MSSHDSRDGGTAIPAPAIRKIRLKFQSSPSSKSSVPFPALPFSPEWQEVVDDPSAAGDASIPPPDPRLSSEDAPRWATLSSDDSSSLPDLTLAGPTVSAAGKGKQKRSLRRADPTPSPRKTKRPRSKKGPSHKPSTSKAPAPSTKKVKAPSKKEKHPKQRARSSSVASSVSPAPSKSQAPSDTAIDIAIDLEIKEETTGRGRKGKEQEKTMKIDAFKAKSSAPWSTILDKIAEKLRTEVQYLRQDTFYWRPAHPKNAEERSLNSEEAWNVCVMRLEQKAKAAFIVIRMAHPNPAPERAPWLRSPVRRGGPSTFATQSDDEPPPPPSTNPFSADSLPPSVGQTDRILVPVVQKLQNLYQKGNCAQHPTQHCYLHVPTGRHFAVEGLAAKAWALAIHNKGGDYYRMPNSPHFHPEKALPLPDDRRITQPEQPQPAASQPALQPITPAVQLPQQSFMNPFTPFAPFNPFALFGMSPQPPFPQPTPRQPAGSIPSGPLSSPPRGMTLKEWCAMYKLDESQHDGLVKLRFKIGMELDDVPEKDWKGADFTHLSWKQTREAAAAYCRARKQARLAI